MRALLINNLNKMPLEAVKYMAKRGTTLSIKERSRHSHKTKKRLEIKRLMLLKKNSKKGKSK